MWSKKRISVAFTPRKLKRPSLLFKRRTPTVNRSSSSNIKVVVRVRPQNEKDNACRQIIHVVDEECLIFDPKEGEDEFYVGGHKQLNRDMLKKRNKNIEFQFDHVFDEGASNLEVFEGTTQSLIESLLDGYNCSVFVYGATGAGKTYTMLGSKETPGIAYLTMVELYKQMGDVHEDYKFDLQISYLEVYNETVKDLISPSGPLNLRDDGRDGVVISGIKTHRIDSAEELFQMLERGNKNRTQHPTDANAESSRSHAVFQVHLFITHKISMESKTAKLTMIDLAGSERGGVTGGKGARFSEGSNINKSLLALGNCVDALAEGQKHIPYRNSKLTRILKDSLGGNCKTVMIVNVAPSNCAYEETFNTLNYANRAKKINNKARRNLMNVDMTASQYKKIIEDLKQKLILLENENKALKDNNCPQKNESIRLDSPRKISSKSDIDNARDVLKCCYELEGKYRREIVMYQMKIRTLDWRIHQKKVIGERLQVFEYMVGDYKVTSKMDESTKKLKLQKCVFKEKVKALQKLLKEKIEMREIALREIQEKGIMEELKGDIEVYDKKMNQESASNQVSYLKDLILKQQNEMASSDKIINLLCKTMDYYYSVLKGYGRISDKMEADYLQLVQKLAGIKGVSWQDETCDYNLLRKIIDLSFTSDKSSNGSPANPPVTEGQEQIIAVDNALEKNDEFLTMVTPEFNKSLNKQTQRKFNNPLSVVKECPSPYEHSVNETNEYHLQVPSTPSVGLQCIAEYLSPEDDSVKDAFHFTDTHPLPMLPETPSLKYLDETCNDNKSLLGSHETDFAAIAFEETPAKSFNKTFVVPQSSLDSGNVSPDPVKCQTPELSFTMITDEGIVTSLNSTFTTDSPLLDQSQSEKSNSICNVEKIPLFDHVFSSEILEQETESKPSDTKTVDASLKDTLYVCDPTVTSESVQVIDDHNIEEITSANNSHRSLNTTFTSISPSFMSKNEECDELAADQSPQAPVTELNLTFNTPTQMDDESEIIENDSETITHNSTFDSTSRPSKNNTSLSQHKSTPDLNSTFTSSGSTGQKLVGEGKASLLQVNANVSNPGFLTTDLQVTKGYKTLATSNKAKDSSSVSKIALSSFNAATANNSCEEKMQPNAKNSVLPRMKNPLLSKPVTSPSYKARPVSANKISFSVKKSGSQTNGSSTILQKIKSGAERNHPYSNYSREIPLHSSGGLKVKPRGTVKIHFNPLSDKNKVQQVPAKVSASWVKGDPENFKRKHPSPVCSSTNMKENKIPVPLRISTPQLQPKYEVKILRHPSVPTKKTLDRPIKR